MKNNIEITSLIISIIILIVVIIIIIIVCYNQKNQTSNTVQNPELVLGAIYANNKNKFSNAEIPNCPSGQNVLEIKVVGTCNTSNGKILNCANKSTPSVNYRCGDSVNCPKQMSVQNITIYCNTKSGCHNGKTSIICKAED